MKIKGFSPPTVYISISACALVATILSFQNCGGGFEADRSDTTSTLSLRGLSVDGLPEKISSESSAVLLFRSDEPMSPGFDCHLDEVVFYNCQSPWTLSNLTDGEHTLKIIPKDPGVSSLIYSWTTALPEIKVIFASPPTIVTPLVSETLHFNILNVEMNAITLLCTLDGEDLGECESPFQTPDLEPGEHSFEVRVIKDGEEVAKSATTWEVNLDSFTAKITTAPLSILNSFVYSTNTSDAKFTIKILDKNGNVRKGSLRCYLSPAEIHTAPTPSQFAPCGFPSQSFGRLPEGSYLVYFEVTDEYNRVVGEPIRHYFNIDRTPPKLRALEFVKNGFRTHHSSVVIPIESSGATKTEYMIEGRDSVFKEGEVTWEQRQLVLNNLSPGSYHVRIRTIDGAENVSETQRISFTVTPNNEFTEIYKGQDFRLWHEALETQHHLVLKGDAGYLFIPNDQPGSISRSSILPAIQPYFQNLTPLHIKSTFRGGYEFRFEGNGFVVLGGIYGTEMIVDTTQPSGPKILSHHKNFGYASTGRVIAAVAQLNQQIALLLIEEGAATENRKFRILIRDYNDPADPKLTVTNHYLPLTDLPPGRVSIGGVASNGSHLVAAFRIYRDNEETKTILRSFRVNADYSLTQTGELLVPDGAQITFQLAGNHLLLKKNQWSTTSPSVSTQSADIFSVSNLALIAHIGNKDPNDHSITETKWYAYDSSLCGYNTLCNTQVYAIGSGGLSKVAEVPGKVEFAPRDFRVYSTIDNKIQQYRPSNGGYFKYSEWRRPATSDIFEHKGYLMGVSSGTIEVYSQNPREEYSAKAIVEIPCQSSWSNFWPFKRVGDRLYIYSQCALARGTRGSFTVFDISNPLRITKLSEFYVEEHQIENFAVIENYLYAVTFFGLFTYPIGTSSTLNPIAKIDFGLPIDSPQMAVYKNKKLFVSSTNARRPNSPQSRFFGIAEIDLSLSASPRLLSIHEVAGIQSTIISEPFHIVGDYAYIHGRERSDLFRLSLTNPLQPAGQLEYFIETKDKSENYFNLTIHPSGTADREYWQFEPWSSRNSSITTAIPHLAGMTLDRGSLIFEVTYGADGKFRVTKAALDFSKCEIYCSDGGGAWNILFSPVSRVFSFIGGRLGFRQIDEASFMKPISEILRPE